MSRKATLLPEKETLCGKKDVLKAINIYERAKY